MPNVCTRKPAVYLLGHQPATHQGHDREAPAEPAGGGLLLAAHARDPVPGDAAESGLNQYLFAMTNIATSARGSTRTIPRGDGQSGGLDGMAVGRARHLKALQTGQLP